jgi:hypothetical protein
VDARDEDAHNNDARDEIARVAAHDVKHMLSRSGLHEIVELARSVTENSSAQEMPIRRGPGGLTTSDRTADCARAGTRQAPGARPGPSGQQGPASRQGPGGPNGSVAPHGGSRYPMRGE